MALSAHKSIIKFLVWPFYKITDSAEQGVPNLGINLAANAAINNTFVNYGNACRQGSGAIGIDNVQPGAVPVLLSLLPFLSIN